MYNELPCSQHSFLHHNIYLKPGHLELYNSIEIGALCSKNEGFGLAVTESLACGKPVIGTKVGGIPIQVKDGKNGFLVDVGDYKGTANAIIKLLSDKKLRDKMGQNSLDVVEENFKIERGIEKHMMLYNSLIEYKDEFKRIDYLKTSDFRAIVTDLDGTITDKSPKQYFDPNDFDKDLFKDLKSLKLPLILTTARPIFYVKKLANKFKVWSCIIAENGAVVYFPKTKKTITTNTFYMTKAKKIIREMNLPETTIGKIMAAFDKKHESLVKETLGDLCDHLSFVKNVNDIIVLPNGVDKGMALRLALRHLNFDLDKTLILGDGENDIDMFLNPGFKVAMANAHPKLKKLANEVSKFPSIKGVTSIIKKIKENENN